jgi:hypothetical protein
MDKENMVYIYPFIGCWTPLLFTQFGYCKESCSKYGYADISIEY